ncbi:ATP-grasp domain-containing protein [Robertkochia aurantiaca]|uniref:ATP-grasp domain-containing protein n=1 Tax=Robertkochia aurantiaca TaxID=2873700 RepID=UPI001CC90F99|nr:ATP-grasp domain-containing protein [Robertkochia sp. 3YJGBD-33]
MYSTDLKSWYIKATSREHWPSWVLYLPVIVQHFWLSIRAGSLFWFLQVNPGFERGFLLSDSKLKIYGRLPSHQVPETILIRKGEACSNVLQEIKRRGLAFPLILKPDIGFRGLGVHFVRTEPQLEDLLKDQKIDLLLQEFVNHKLEVGVFYARIPGHRNGNILSLTLKEFLTVTGNGKDTLSFIIRNDPRACLQWRRLKDELGDRWQQVPQKGERILLETIGNHNRGCKFVNGHDLIDDKLCARFDQISDQIEGFWYGRFDIKVPSIDHLRSGDNIKILELNGIGAEPTHVYDPETGVFQAWKDMLFTWRKAFEIAMAHREKGVRFPVYSEAKDRYLQYRKYKSIAFNHKS